MTTPAVFALNIGGVKEMRGEERVWERSGEENLGALWVFSPLLSQSAH